MFPITRILVEHGYERIRELLVRLLRHSLPCGGSIHSGGDGDEENDLLSSVPSSVFESISGFAVTRSANASD